MTLSGTKGAHHRRGACVVRTMRVSRIGTNEVCLTSLKLPSTLAKPGRRSGEPKMKTTTRICLLASLLAALTSCAVGNSAGPRPPSMPAARAALAPEYRIFYDALQDYGDWVLIEPYGYLFRPRTAFHDWMPYEDGFWAPTDAFGWVWISNEPFGWATYHYGRWAYDEFQGWVWKPGVDWAPAWVDWRANEQYVGWAPLNPSGRPPNVPGGAYLFTTVGAMGTANLAGSVKKQDELGAAVAGAKPVNETVVINGVRAPAGPSVERIEQILGQRFQRVHIDDALTQKPIDEAHASASTPGGGLPTVDQLRKAGEQTSRDAKAMSERGGRPSGRVPLLRPQVERGVAPKGGIPNPAKKDTTASRPGG